MSFRKPETLCTRLFMSVEPMFPGQAITLFWNTLQELSLKITSFSMFTYLNKNGMKTKIDHSWFPYKILVNTRLHGRLVYLSPKVLHGLQ